MHTADIDTDNDPLSPSVSTPPPQVKSVDPADPSSVTLTVPFAGDFSDIAQAYYAPCPASGLLSYAATSDEVDTYLEAQLAALYPQYLNNFEVARQTLSAGYGWLVTFTGEMFIGGVDPLILLASNGGTNNLTSSFTPSLTTFATAAGVVAGTSKSIVTTVTTIAQAGALKAGVPYYVRLAAVNAVGVGAFSSEATNGNKTEANALGQLVARSPPGLARNVLVYAVPDSQGDWLKVTWEQGETYGAPILWYDIQTRETSSLLWTTALNISAGVLAASGNTTFEARVPVIPYHSYEVRVVPHNDQGGAGPVWFSKIQTDPLFVSAVSTPFGTCREMCVCVLSHLLLSSTHPPVHPFTSSLAVQADIHRNRSSG